MTDMHIFSHEELITSLDTFCRFLVQVSTYLNILLPNTIHLPTEGRSIIVLEHFQNPGISRLLRRSLSLRELTENHPKKLVRFFDTVAMIVENVAHLCHQDGLVVDTVEEASDLGGWLHRQLVNIEGRLGCVEKKSGTKEMSTRIGWREVRDGVRES
jgi:hypothetical protein